MLTNYNNNTNTLLNMRTDRELKIGEVVLTAIITLYTKALLTVSRRESSTDGAVMKILQFGRIHNPLTRSLKHQQLRSYALKCILK